MALRSDGPERDSSLISDAEQQSLPLNDHKARAVYISRSLSTTDSGMVQAEEFTDLTLSAYLALTSPDEIV